MGRNWSGWTTGEPGPGAAYVFTCSDGVWDQQTELTASDGADWDDFGAAVAIDGNAILVGAPRPTSGDVVGHGVAYLFAGSGSIWTQQAKLTAPDGADGDEFGNSVALDGPTIALVGAPFHTVGLIQEGTVYAFTSDGATWSKTAELSPPDGLGDAFGSSVAVDDSTNTALIGAPDDPVKLVDQGGAYVYRRSGKAWVQQCPALAASDGTTSTDFGAAVAISGSNAVIGAYEYPSGLSRGAAYVDQLNPAPSPLLKASSRSVVLGRKVTLRGTVANSVAADRTLAIDRKVGSKLKLLKNVKLSSSGGYRWVLKPNKVGKWVLLISYKASGQTFKSKTVTVTVRK